MLRLHWRMHKRDAERWHCPLTVSRCVFLHIYRIPYDIISLRSALSQVSRTLLQICLDLAGQNHCAVSVVLDWHLLRPLRKKEFYTLSKPANHKCSSAATVTCCCLYAKCQTCRLGRYRQISRTKESEQKQWTPKGTATRFEEQPRVSHKVIESLLLNSQNHKVVLACLPADATTLATTMELDSSIVFRTILFGGFNSKP